MKNEELKKPKKSHAIKHIEEIEKELERANYSKEELIELLAKELYYEQFRGGMRGFS